MSKYYIYIYMYMQFISKMTSENWHIEINNTVKVYIHID